MWIGDLAGVAAVMAETESIDAATGRYSGFLLPVLRALQGREAEASALIAGVLEQAASPGREGEATAGHWAAAVLYNGLARYEEAKSAARDATRSRFDPWTTKWALAELVEAAVRGGDAELARDALERLAEMTQPAGTDFALGIEAWCRALLADGDSADVLYREAIERLERRQLRPDQARAHLLYGEWLRREGRRVDAREQLRTAHDLFDAIGMEAFAERAGWELVATARRCASAAPRHATNSLDRRSRSPDSLGTACRTRRSPASSSSARGRSSGICARCSPSCTSTLAGSFEKHCPRVAGPARPDRAFRSLTSSSRFLNRFKFLNDAGPPVRTHRPTVHSTWHNG